MINNELNFSNSSFLNDFSQKNSFSKEINNFSPNKIPLKLSNKKYFPKFYQKSNSSNNSFSSEKNDSPLKNCLTNELLETINGENNSPINNIKNNNNIEFFNKIYTFDKDKTPKKFLIIIIILKFLKIFLNQIARYITVIIIIVIYVLRVEGIYISIIKILLIKIKILKIKLMNLIMN
jgi:hypothetical protein